jgi:hypothetical protein
MDDSHIDNMIVLAPTSRRQGLMAFSDGPVLDAEGQVVFNLSDRLGHGQRVGRVRTRDGEELLVFADRGRLGNDLWKTGKVLGVSMDGTVRWEVTPELHGHRVNGGMGIYGSEVIHGVAGGADLFCPGELGGWGGDATSFGHGTPRRGADDYYVHLFDPEGRELLQIPVHDTGADRKGGGYPGTGGFGLDLDGDGREEFYTTTMDCRLIAYDLEV